MTCYGYLFNCHSHIVSVTKQHQHNTTSGVPQTIEMTEQLEISSPNDSENNRKRKRLTVLVLLVFLGSLRCSVVDVDSHVCTLSSLS